MHEQFWERLAGLPREETAQRAKCRYLAESDSFVVPLLSMDYLVAPARRTIHAAQASEQGSQTRNVAFGVPDHPAGYLQQLCLLAYLVDAKELPLSGRLVSVEKLDPGGFFFRGSHRLPVEKLASVFGPDTQLLLKVGQALNAVPRAFGDASIELCVLPRIPVTLVIWAADEELGPGSPAAEVRGGEPHQTRNDAFGEPFPARASIFFDQSAATQLPLDVLFAVAALTIDGVLSTVKTIT